MQSHPAPVTITKNNLVLPPSTLLQPCTLPQGYDPNHPFANMKITNDIANGYLDWLSGGSACGKQVDRLIEWYKDAEKQISH